MKLQKILFILFFSMTLGSPMMSFTQSMSDFDGNVYTTVKINQQTWLGQNLNVSHFRNGDPIPEATSEEAWEKASIEKKPAWTYYETSSDYGMIYGKLYNWFAVNDARGLAPNGSHIPTEAEWNVLVVALGGENKAGNKLKEKGTEHWRVPNKAATNESGFTALPGGLNYSFGSFVSQESKGFWWTSTADSNDTAILYSVTYDRSDLSNLFFNKGVGLSVRCIKD